MASIFDPNNPTAFNLLGNQQQEPFTINQENYQQPNANANITASANGMTRNQKIGYMLAALSDAFAGRDVAGRAMERAQAFRQQAEVDRQRQEALRKQELLQELSKDSRYTEMIKLSQAGLDPKLATSPERKIVKGADGYNYFAGTGERVLPNISKEDSVEYKSKKDAAGYLRYTEGPQTGERVFPEVVIEQKPDIKDEASLRKEFNDQSKNFKSIGQSYGKVLATDPTAAGDVSLIFAYMKMLDPGSVVREGEQATAANAAGVPAKISNLYNRVITGEKLVSSQRADFRKQAQNIYELELQNQSLNISRYKNIAESKGFNPEDIVFDFSEGLQPIIFEDSLRNKSLDDLEKLDATKYNQEELDILSKVLSEKLKLKING
jgi:hypothetical protein